MTSPRALLGLLAAAALWGCGFNVPSQSSCDFRPQAAECTDLLTNRNSQVEATLKGLCVGTYSEGLCNHTGSLGGCECDGCDNGKSITWEFPNPDAGVATADDVKRICDGRPYVAP